MTIDIVASDADYSKNAWGFIPPVTAGLEYFNLFCIPTIKPGRNMAPDGANGAAYGSPAVSSVVGQPWYTPMGNNAIYIDTGITETDAITILSVAGQNGDPSADYVYAVGSYGGAGYGGANILGVATSAHNFSGAIGRSDTIEYVGNSLSTAFHFLSVRAASGVATIFDDMTTATRTTGTDTNARQLSNQTFKIGAPGIPTVPTSGVVNMALTAIFSRMITDAELTAFYQWTQKVFTKVGVGIGV